MNKSELWLPAPYDSKCVDDCVVDKDLEIHERLANTPLIEFTSEMPQSSEVQIAKDDSIRYVDLRDKNEPNSNEAILLALPYANGYSASMHIRARVLQEYMPGSRVIVFPNNTLTEYYYKFSEKEAPDAIVALGKKIVRACVKLGVENVNINGFSQGASVGGVIIKESKNEMSVEGAILGDPANVTKRTIKQIKKDFLKGGIKDLNKGINDSGIPALSKAQRSRGGLESVLQLAKLGFGNITSSQLNANKALYNSMTNDDFILHLEEAKYHGDLPDKLMIARMAGSLICTEELDIQLDNIGLSDKLVVVDGYGHVGGDNLILNAILSRSVFTGETIPR